jgi:hypothetical protein
MAPAATMATELLRRPIIRHGTNLADFGSCYAHEHSVDFGARDRVDAEDIAARGEFRRVRRALPTVHPEPSHPLAETE